jgi:hypothetical protein
LKPDIGIKGILQQSEASAESITLAGKGQMSKSVSVFSLIKTAKEALPENQSDAGRELVFASIFYHQSL